MKGSSPRLDRLSQAECDAASEFLGRKGLSQAGLTDEALVGSSAATVSRLLAGRPVGRHLVHRMRDLLRQEGLLPAALRLVNAEYLLDSGWKPEEIFEAVTAVDRQIEERVEETTIGCFCSKYQRYPETSRLILTSSDDVVGYSGIVPLREEAFRALTTAGSRVSSVLRTENLAAIEFTGVFSAYISGVALDLDHQGFQAKKLLFLSLVDMLTELAVAGVFFHVFAAHAWSVPGAQICENFMRPDAPIETEDGPLYVRRVPPLPQRPLFVESKLPMLYSRLDNYRE